LSDAIGPDAPSFDITNALPTDTPLSDVSRVRRAALRRRKRMLSEFLTANRDEIIALTRVQAARRTARLPTEIELRHGVPLFFSQLIEALRESEGSTDDIKRSAALNGSELLRSGLSVAQVIHCYGDLCQAVTELAGQRDADISPAEFHTFNRCLDDAMASAATAYAEQRDRTIADQSDQRMGVLAHELRNLLGTAILAHEALKRGGVGLASGTGAVLERSLRGMVKLSDRSIADVRLRAGAQTMERVLLAKFVEEIEVAAMLEARARGMSFSVEPGEYGLAVEADRQSLAAAVTNLLQNAFKFTLPHGHVALRVVVDADRVLMEVEDGCGGLPPGRAEELFLPYEQRGDDRSGLGLGLSISRRAVEASGGELRVRNLPGKGCIFTVDLPRQIPGAAPTRMPAHR